MSHTVTKAAQAFNHLAGYIYCPACPPLTGPSVGNHRPSDVTAPVRNNPSPELEETDKKSLAPVCVLNHRLQGLPEVS